MRDEDINVIVEVVDPTHLREVWRLFGAAEVLEQLKEADCRSTPGMSLAIALAEKTVADFRARMAGESLRAVSRAGYDITKYDSIVTTVQDEKPVVLLSD